MKRLTTILVIFAALAMAPSSVLAQATNSAPAATAAKAPDLFKLTDGGPVTVVQAAPSSATVDTGTYAGQALVWVVTVFGGVIGTALTGLIVNLMKKAGVDATEAMRAKLQDTIVNGLNLGAAKAAKDLQGQGQVVIKDAAVAQAVTYVQAHGADTLKKLGLDPTSPEAVEAIKARIETAISDEKVPTAAVLDGPANVEAAPAKPEVAKA